jgi:hypothetical protein
VWVSLDGQVQLLDLPFPGAKVLPPLELLAEVSVLLLEGKPRTDAHSPRAPLPLFARRLLEGLPRFGGTVVDVPAFHEQLIEAHDRPGRVLPAIRGPLLALLALLAAPPLVSSLAVLWFVSFFYLGILEPGRVQADRLLFERRQREAVTAAVLVLPSSHPLSRLPGTAVLVEQQEMTLALEEGLERGRQNASERRSSMSRIDRLLFEQVPWNDFYGAEPTESLDDRTDFAIACLAVHPKPVSLPEALRLTLLLFTPAFCVLAALVFRGGLRHYSLGVRLVRRDGRRAGRLRCGWRALAAWAVVVCWVLLQEYTWRKQLAYLGDFGWIVLGVLTPVSLAVMLRTPARSLHDRLAGTWLVPR